MKFKHFESFETFADLDDTSKLLAAKTITEHKEAKGTQLFDVGDNDTTEYFLISGEVELIAYDGIKKRITGGDSTAYFPLALLRPRKFAARVVSETASFLKISVDTLRQLRQTVTVAGDDLSAFSSFCDQGIETLFTPQNDAEAIKKFLVNTTAAIEDNRLNIANFDDVSTTILNAIRDPNVSIDVLVSAVQLDAAITAKILKAANSAFFSGLAAVDTVRSAIVRLGVDLSLQLISVMVLKEVFSTDNENLDEAMRKLWLSSIKLATYSVVLGKRMQTGFQQGQTLVAGLMNDIGLIAIINYLDKFPSAMETITEQVLSSSMLKKKLGIALLTHWQFPQSIINVIQYSDDYYRDTENESSDLSDIVCIAQLLIRLTSYRKVPFDDITQIPAYQRLGLDSRDANLIHEIQEEALKYTQLFSGAS